MLKLFVSVLSLILYARAGTALSNGLILQNVRSARIVGGSMTSINSYPWQISLQRYGSHACGGTIYSDKIIITAAHCLQAVSADVLKVRAGSTYWNSGGVLIQVAAFKVHAGYEPSSMLNDIALINLQKILTFNASIWYISLALTAPRNGAAAVVTGWGASSYGETVIPRALQYADVTIVGQKECASGAYGYGAQIKPTMLCAYAVGKSACLADDGGPLVVAGELAGIVSWSYGCAFHNYPGVYTDVAAYRLWIAENAFELGYHRH